MKRRLLIVPAAGSTFPAVNGIMKWGIYMKDIYIITGANGHLGSTIIRALRRHLRNHASNIQEVWGLILPGEEPPFKEDRYIHWYYGDVTDISSLVPLFAHTGDSRIIVIHTAGIIDITASSATDKMMAVNVGGTKNMVAASLAHNVFRFLYVSSVHAIPELPDNETIIETKDFSPDKVVGGYAKTKAEATRYVLGSVAMGLPAIVVHPSGIIGPFDTQRNHMVAVIRDYISGKLPACVKGGYDFVDVRDVAAGCLAAVHKGKIGECYILSNEHLEVKKMLDSVKSMAGTKKVPLIPMWMAKIAAPFLGLGAKIRHTKPVYTRYSLYTLKSNGHFSHDKATRELGYRPRSLKDTLKDTLRWLRIHKIGRPLA